MIRISLLLVLGLFIVSELCATTFYIDPINGNDSNAGTIGFPFKTLTKANTTAIAGDIVIMRGGLYDCAITGNLYPQNSGTETARIVFQNYQGEKPVITNSNATSSKYAIDLTNRSFITIKGIEVNGFKLYDQSNCDHWVLLNNSTNIILDSCSFFYAKGWDGVLLENQSNYNQFISCTFDYCGTWDTERLWRPSTNSGDNGGKPANDAGDLFWIKCGQFNLVENCVMKHGGHDLFIIDDRYNVVRNNVFNNDWSSHSALPGLYIGARPAAFTGRQNKTCLGGGKSEQASGGFNLIENNVFTGAGWNPDAYRNQPVAVKLEGLNQIFRFNRVGNNFGWAVRTTTRDVNPHASKNVVYNNVLFNNSWGGYMIRDYDDPGSVSARENVCMNNILYMNRNNPRDYANDYSDYNDSDFSAWLIWLDPDNRKNNQFNNNLVFNGNEKSAMCYVKNEGDRNKMSWFNSNHKNITDNIEASPMFIHSQLDIYSTESFKLYPTSQAIDKGGIMTKPTNSGTGTVIPVENPGFFFSTRFKLDGVERQYNNFEGKLSADKIQIGKQVAQIVAIDYDAKTITVNKSLAWEIGDGISLPYNGSAPDIGIWESEPSGKNLAPMVDAGANQTLNLKQEPILLKGYVTDDGLPQNAPISTVWKQVAGPSNVVFSDSLKTETTVTINKAGEYTFELKAGDGELFSKDQVRITVVEPKEVKLEVHYDFNEGKGLIANDKSGNNRHATIFGAEWGEGRSSGYSLKFDGDPDGKVKGDSLIVIDYKGISESESRSITAWVKVQTHGTIVSWGNRTGNGAIWTLRVDNSTFAPRLEVTGGYIRGTTPLNDGKWHHVAVVFEKDDSPDVTDAKLYVDGKEEIINASGAREIQTGSALNLMIGSNVLGRHLNGEIDDLRIYSGALSIDQISQLIVSNHPEIKLKKLGLNLWPNPASEMLIYQVNADSENDFQVILFEASGKIITTNTEKNLGPGALYKLNIGHLSPGMYYLQIKTTMALSEVIKFIKL